MAALSNERVSLCKYSLTQNKKLKLSKNLLNYSYLIKEHTLPSNVVIANAWPYVSGEPGALPSTLLITNAELELIDDEGLPAAIIPLLTMLQSFLYALGNSELGWSWVPSHLSITMSPIWILPSFTVDKVSLKFYIIIWENKSGSLKI